MNDLKSIFSLYRIDSKKGDYLVLSEKNANEFRIKAIVWPEIKAELKPEGQGAHYPPSNHPSCDCKVTELPENVWSIEENTDSIKASISNKYKIIYEDEAYDILKNKSVRLI